MPGFLDKAKNAVTDNLGITEKAVIEIIDVNVKKVQEANAVRVVGGAGAAANKVAGGSVANKGLLGDQIKSLQKSGKVIGDRYIDIVADKGRKYFTVQFNPSTLSLQGHAGGLVQKIDFGGGKAKDREMHRSASYSRGVTSIIMFVSLFFDSCDNQGAFLDDKLTMNPTSVGTGVAKSIMQATGNKKVSVQTEVEGFIAALRNPDTRLVTFHWGEFAYSGILRNVGANYTMFNPNGEPIRATVDLSIACADDELWENSLAVWQERYINAFKKSESFVKTSQKMGKLLNI